MWVLYIVSLMHGGISVEWIGGYDTYEQCMYEMREAEIAVNSTSETMVCLQAPLGVNGLY